MANLLTVLLAILTTTFSATAICMAFWTWHTFRVSVLMWLVVARAAQAAAALTEVSIGRSKIESAVTAIQAQNQLAPHDLLSVMLSITHLLPILGSLALMLIALGEFAHFGPRLVPSYEPRRALTVLFRIRHVLGVSATILSMLPSAAFHLWARTHS